MHQQATQTHKPISRLDKEPSDGGMVPVMPVKAWSQLHQYSYPQRDIHNTIITKQHNKVDVSSETNNTGPAGS